MVVQHASATGPSVVGDKWWIPLRKCGLSVVPALPVSLTPYSVLSVYYSLVHTVRLLMEAVMDV